MLFGVFDGHGGKEVAEYAKENFKKIFLQQEYFKKGDYKKALEKSFLDIDNELQSLDYADQCGATACVVFVN